MASRALGTVKQGDVITVTVRHDPRDSYGRSVIPCAVRNVSRLGLWAGWVTYEAHLTDVSQGDVTESEVTFTRTA